MISFSRCVACKCFQKMCCVQVFSKDVLRASVFQMVNCGTWSIDFIMSDWNYFWGSGHTGLVGCSHHTTHLWFLTRRSRCRSNCTWPFGWVSRWSYINARLRVLQSILQIVSVGKLTFWRVFWKAKSSSFVLVQKASFQAKNWQSYEKKKIGEANLRQRWNQPRQRWDQCKFLYTGRFSIFPGTWPNLFWVRQCNGETWKKRKERTKEKKPVAESKKKRFL